MGISLGENGSVIGKFGWEKGNWPLIEEPVEIDPGDPSSGEDPVFAGPQSKEQLGKNLEDLRKHLFLLQYPNAGFYPNPSDPTQQEIDDGTFDDNEAWQDAYSTDDNGANWGAYVAGQVIYWKGNAWICNPAERLGKSPSGLSDDWGIKNSTAREVLGTTDPADKWNAIKPPDDINSAVNTFETRNRYWSLLADPNLYHNWDEKADRYVFASDAGPNAEFYYLQKALVNLPRSVDSARHHDGDTNNIHSRQGDNESVYDASEDDITRHKDDFGPLARRDLIHNESVQPIQSSEVPVDSTDVPLYDVPRLFGYRNQYIPTPPLEGDGGTETTDIQDSVTKGAMDEWVDLDMDTPSIAQDSRPDAQVHFTAKLCNALLNQFIAQVESMGDIIYRPTNNTYRRNMLEKMLHWDKANVPVFDDTISTSFVAGDRFWYEDGPDESDGPLGENTWHVYIAGIDAPDSAPDYGLVEWDEKYFTVDDVRWDTGRWSQQNDLAALSDIFWCCNSSSYECLLDWIGDDFYDWWYDTSTPYMPDNIKDRGTWYNVGASAAPLSVVENRYFYTPRETGGGATDWRTHTEYVDGNQTDQPDFTDIEVDTMFPKPHGTWRRCLKGSMGRPDHRETEDYDDSDYDSISLTRSHMMDGSEIPDNSANGGWKPMVPVSGTSGATVYTTGASYVYEDVVTYNSKFWSARTSIPSAPATLDTDDWDEIFGGGEYHFFGNSISGGVGAEMFVEFEVEHPSDTLKIGSLWDNPEPWPGIWTDETTKYEQWSGHNFDYSTTPNEQRPAHEGYYVSGVESYIYFTDTLEYTITGDGRPTFQNTNSGGGASLRRGYDPIDITAGGVHFYEISEHFVDGLRNMLCRCNIREFEIESGDSSQGNWGMYMSDGVDNMDNCDFYEDTSYDYSDITFQTVEDEFGIDLLLGEWPAINTWQPFDDADIYKLGAFQYQHTDLTDITGRFPGTENTVGFWSFGLKGEQDIGEYDPADTGFIRDTHATQDGGLLPSADTLGKWVDYFESGFYDTTSIPGKALIEVDDDGNARMDLAVCIQSFIINLPEINIGNIPINLADKLQVSLFFEYVVDDNGLIPPAHLGNAIDYAPIRVGVYDEDNIELSTVLIEPINNGIPVKVFLEVDIPSDTSQWNLTVKPILESRTNLPNPFNTATDFQVGCSALVKVTYDTNISMLMQLDWDNIPNYTFDTPNIINLEQI